MPTALTRSFISIRGKDSLHFLQTIITNDVTKLTPEKPLFTVVLSPQGKLLMEGFLIFIEQDHLLLDLHPDLLAPSLALLKKYRLRSEVSIEDSSLAFQVYALSFDDPTTHDLQCLLRYPDPRTSAMGIRLLYPKERHPTYPTLRPHDYTIQRLTLGIPEIGEKLPSGEYYPLECGYEQLHAIDFQKGCYVGQEVTARSKYRGTIKKHLMRITSQEDLPDPKSTLYTKEMLPMGIYLGGTHHQGLALIRNDSVSDIIPIDAYYATPTAPVCPALLSRTLLADENTPGT